MSCCFIPLECLRKYAVFLEYFMTNPTTHFSCLGEKRLFLEQCICPLFHHCQCPIMCLHTWKYPLSNLKCICHAVFVSVSMSQPFTLWQEENGPQYLAPKAQHYCLDFRRRRCLLVYLDSRRGRRHQRLGNLATLEFSPSMENAGLVNFSKEMKI